ncbi:hypothetical protein B0J17DRAFT_641144 [Rhizoctonia solani]|nr:hypothetical protein B0J17DRAFT_641144 [Rhizoctonia solani]
MLNLLVADLIMALGAILDIHWASSSQVSCGQVCTAQGVMQLVGETSVALFTLAITLLTFIAVVRGRAVKARVWVWGGIAASVWAFVALWAGIGGALEGFYAPTPYWCWISSEYKAERIGAEYAWLWISGFGSIILYTLLHLILRGNIKWEPAVGWASLAWSWRKEDSTSGNPVLWYSLAYTITIIPLSIVRWISFNGFHINAASSFVAVSIFNLSGLINVGLILFARTGVFLPCTRTSGVDSQPESTQLSDDDPMQEHQTGFGGARVVNQRDFNVTGQNIGSGRGGDAPSGGLRLESAWRDLAAPLVNTGKASELGPGRTYLESLGIRMNS